MGESEYLAILTCPECGFQEDLEMPTDYCQFFHECSNCKVVFRPKAGDDCVFCSYSDKLCPPKTAGRGRTMIEPTDLHTERLLLRPYSLADVDDVYTYAKDETWGRFLPVPVPYNYHDAEEFIAKAVLKPWDKVPGFAIVLNGKVIGGIGLSVNKDIAISMLGYSIARQHWGKGLMTEAAQAVTNWGFETFDLAKVYAYADVRNTGSWRVMEKLGMTREGQLRSHGVTHGERCDFYYYGILRDEWNAVRHQ